MADNLYCPRCSNRFSIDTSYCRNCGLSLDAVSKIVTGEAANAPVITTRPNFKLFRLGIGLVILGLVIGLINGALRDFGLYPDSYGKMLFLVIVAAGMLMLGAGFVFPTKKYIKARTTESEATSDTEKAPAELIDANFDSYISPRNTRPLEQQPLASVTESTTRDLKRIS